MIRLAGVLLLFLTNYSWAQINLVPNYSFEINTGCDELINNVVVDWKIFSYATCDYYHPCSNLSTNGVPSNFIGYQQAKQGTAYSGIYTFNRSSPSFRDYLVVELTDSIIKGVPYLIKFHVSPTDKCRFGIYHLGAYLSPEPPGFAPGNLFTHIPQIENKPENPLSDTSAWIMVADTFISTVGGEKFISIGNFKDDASTDTVSYNYGNNYYSVSYYYVDDVWVTPLDSGVGIGEVEDNSMFKLYPNPTNGQMTLEYDLAELPEAYLNYMYGQLVSNYRLKQGKNKIDVNLSELVAGIYIVQITSNDKSLYKEKVIIFK